MQPTTNTITQGPSTPGNSLAQSQEIVDRVVYLASLASRRQDVEAMMDPLRAITARWDKVRPLNPNELATLNGLEAKLKHYLINDDPLRTFTEQTLQERLTENQARGMRAGRFDPATRSLAFIIFSSLAIAGLGYGLPFLPLAIRSLLVVPLLFLGIHLGITWFYLTALKNFNQAVRKVFIYFCVAAIFFAIGFSHYIVIEAFGLSQYEVFKYAGIVALFGIPYLMMFLGLRLYAKILGIQSRLTSLPFSLGIAALIMTSAIFIPHATSSSELFFDISAVSGFMLPIFALMGSVLANKIRKQVTPAYRKPMTVLFWYLGVNGLSSIVALAALFFIGEARGAALSVILAVCGLPVQTVQLYASYLFKRETGK